MIRRNKSTAVAVISILWVVGAVAAQSMDDAAMKAHLAQLDPDRAAGAPNLPPATIAEVRQASIGCNQSVDFDAGLPVDWTVINNEPSGPQWGNLASCGEGGNYTNGALDAACASSDVFGSAEFDTELRTPTFSTLGQASVTLTFTSNYQNFANLDFLDVGVSVDGGAGWTTVLSWNEDHGAFRATPGEDVNLDISAEAADQANVIVRWHYYDPNTGDYDWYAQVDDVAVTCVVPVELQSFDVE